MDYFRVSCHSGRHSPTWSYLQELLIRGQATLATHTGAARATLDQTLPLEAVPCRQGYELGVAAADCVARA